MAKKVLDGRAADEIKAQMELDAAKAEVDALARGKEIRARLCSVQPRALTAGLYWTHVNCRNCGWRGYAVTVMGRSLTTALSNTVCLHCGCVGDLYRNTDLVIQSAGGVS